MKNLFFSISLITLAITSACSGKPSVESEQITRNADALSSALQQGNITQAAQLADSMSLWVDDLAPDRVVSVLLTFLEVHNASQGSDVENMRKYVDVYDIALATHGSEVRRALDRARSINPDVDFDDAARTFRAALAEYDAVKTYGAAPTPAVPKDTTSTDSVPNPGTDEEMQASIVTD